MLDQLTLIPASIPFVLNVVNRSAWPGSDGVGEAPASVSVLIPARNEEATIARCVEAALAVVPPVLEVVVCDDGSTDGTRAILTRLQKADPRLRVVDGAPLPTGWVGKPHACHQLGNQARGDILLFVDADTALEPDATQRLGHLFERYRPKVVTAFPRQELGGLFERLVVPMLAMTFTSWLPLDLIWKHVDPRFLIVNGQVLAFRREAYERIGGFGAVRDAIVDDMAICRRAKELDERVVFVDGQHLATTRMYSNAREVWEGFSKNFYAGVGANPFALAFVVTLYFVAFVFPYLRFGWELAVGVPSLAATVAVLFNIGARSLLAHRLGHGVLTVVLHPLGALAVIAIGLNSAWWTMRGQIRWRGRAYTPGA